MKSQNTRKLEVAIFPTTLGSTGLQKSKVLKVKRLSQIVVKSQHTRKLMLLFSSKMFIGL